MNHNQSIGTQGEDLAVAYLLKLGYEIKERNWRFSRSEVDIFAFKNDILHIIEVKTRTSKKFGNPEESIDKAKFKLLQSAAIAYLNIYPNYTKIQFDIIAITILPNTPIDYLHIEDFFF